MIASPLRGLLVSGLMVLLPFAAAATEVGGGGSAATDCWVTFDSIPAVNSGRAVRCADGDVACGDANPRVGYCGYKVKVILNSDQFMPECVPTDLSNNQLLIPYTEAANDDHPKHIDDLQPLQNFIDATLPTVTADQEHVASAFQSVSVPLAIGFTSKGPVFRTTSLTVHTTMCTVPIHGETFCPPPSASDVDNFKLTCTAPKDPMTGKPLSACTGADGNPIAGTLQQIQEHIFDRKCSNLAACHGSMMQAGLCLEADCGGGHGSFADLVGQDPTNGPAGPTGDMLKRVDPGDPANSLLVHKINGGSQLDSKSGAVGAYLLRMPYNNPLIGKTRPKLSRAEIQLITDWITAGAPQTGFVSTTAPGACH